MKKSIIILSFILLTFSTPYKKVIHNTDPEDARCLDGSPGILFLHEGGERDKILIYFEGGGLCAGLTLNQSIEDCYKRSKTPLGSSKYYPDEIDGEDLGYLSPNTTKNKFATWTKIIIAYCDGSLHQSYRKNPLSYKGENLYFRGANVTKSHFKWLLKQHNLAAANKILITGSSAGGVATLVWSNYLRSIVDNPYNVMAAPDSGVFMLYDNFKTKTGILSLLVQNNFKLANVDEKTPLQICNRAHVNEQWKCLFFEYNFAQIQPRMLVINSEYDSWAINNTLGIDCLKLGSSGWTLSACNQEQMNYIEGYREKFKTYISYCLNFSKNSIWTIGCANHGYPPIDEFYDNVKEEVNGMKLKQALQRFALNGERVVEEESDPWPANTGCAY